MSPMTWMNRRTAPLTSPLSLVPCGHLWLLLDLAATRERPVAPRSATCPLTAEVGPCWFLDSPCLDGVAVDDHVEPVSHRLQHELPFRILLHRGQTRVVVGDLL
jgi:hypothetical protein